MDSPEHPMYHRHLNFVVGRMCTQPFGAPLTSKPLLALHAISSIRVDVHQEKLHAAKKLLTERWLARILQHIGEVIETTDLESVLAEKGVGNHRLPLKVVPVVQVEDVVDNGSAESQTTEGDGIEKRSERRMAVENDYDADIEDSGIDCNAPQENDTATMHHAHEQSPTSEMSRELIDQFKVVSCAAGGMEGLTIERFRPVSYPTRRILLREPPSVRTTGQEGRDFLREHIQSALFDKVDEAGLLGEPVQMRRYCPRHWLIRLHSTSDANFLVGKSLDVLGIPCPLESFRSERSQVFVCKAIPRRVNFDDLANTLARVALHLGSSSAHQMYVMKTRRKLTTKAGQCIYVVLDQSSDIVSFTFKCEGHVLHFAAWVGGLRCHYCQGTHSLLGCDKFARLLPNRQSSLLKKQPRLEIEI